MSRVYGVELRVYATAYIVADSESEALAIARTLKDYALELETSGASDIQISGLEYADSDLPDVSLSPAMTVFGPDDDVEIELVHDSEEPNA